MKYKILLLFLSLIIFSGCSQENTSVTVIPDKFETTSPDLRNYYDKVEISSKTTILQLMPTWGKSRLTEEWNISTTASINESGGYLAHNSSIDPNGYAIIRSKERGEYEPGSIAETGIGAKIEEGAVGNQQAEWGAFDDLNGLGWGHNSTCDLYTFVKRDGDKDKLCMTDNPNIDLPEGYNVTNGYIYTARFAWYGEGPIFFYISDYDEENPKAENLIHIEQFEKNITLVDPNQPIRTEVRNRGTADNLQLLIGGRQLSIYNGRGINDQSPFIEQLDDYDHSLGQDVWEPVMSMRAKEFYGDSNRPNSVRIAFKGLSVSCSENCRYRVTRDATSTETGWRGVTWVNESSAVEVKLATETTINVTDRGIPFVGGEVPVSKSADTRSVREDEEVVLGTEDEIILWVYQDGNSPPQIDSTLKWIEQR